MGEGASPGRDERRDRIMGCLLGGAIGDALGAPIEFHSLGRIRREFGAEGMTSYVPLDGRTGVITDDTQMTLFTAEGLMRAHNRWRMRGIADAFGMVRLAYLRWLSTQDDEFEHVQASYEEDKWARRERGWLIKNRLLFDRQAPGNTCLSALRSGVRGEIPPAMFPDWSPSYVVRVRTESETGEVTGEEDVAISPKGPSREGPINDSKGCGGVMRVAPVGLVAGDPFGMAARIAALTHGHPSGYLAAGALARMVAELRDGAAMDEAVSRARAELRQWPGHEETSAALAAAVALAEQGAPTAETVESLGQGWVAEEALAIAVCAALTAADFRSGVLLAVNHSGDSDSTGAIAGNLLGAALGRGGLPDDLVDGLEARAIVEQVAEDMFTHFFDDEADLDRYPPI